MEQLSQRPRVALVIGAQKYKEPSYRNLGAVHDDVDAMVNMLKEKGGFIKVTPCRDPTKRDLVEALNNFKNDIKHHGKEGGCVAVLYYSGHGMMDNSSNHYLLPTDWRELDDISSALDQFACKLEGGTGVLAHLTGAKAAVALFDCCRSFAHQGQARGGPAESKGGWQGPIATPETSEHSLLLCYACPPGATAHEGHEHGHFTEAILKYLCTGQSVTNAVDKINERVMCNTKQRPHVQYFSLTPFNQLCLGLPETSTESQPGSGVPEDQVPRQSIGVQDVTAWVLARLNETCWGRQGTSVAVLAAFGTVAGLLAYFYLVFGIALSITLTGMTVWAVLLKFQLSKGEISLAMAAAGVAAGCLACRWLLVGVSLGICWVMVYPAVHIFFYGPVNTIYFLGTFMFAAAAVVPARCILEFPGSVGLTLGLTIALGEAWCFLSCLDNRSFGGRSQEGAGDLG